jgi:hypothetical protein
MLEVDRIRQSINTIVKKEEEKQQQQLFFTSEEKGKQEQDYTEIEIRMPFFTFHSLDSLEWLLEQYVFVNTHVGFRCTIQADLISGRNENFSIDVLPHQEISMSKWANLSSIYFYSFAEFKNLILNLEDDSMTVFDLVRRTFREGTNLTPKKDPSLMISVCQLRTNH